MKDKLSLVVGIAVGALAMYYLDPRAGRRRRALVRDQMVSAGHDAANLAEAKGKRLIDRVKGLAVTRRLDRQSPRVPESDEQLHDRVRARLGHIISHPRSIEVRVENGCVRLAGHILSRELDPLLFELKDMPGVKSVENQLTCHHSRDGIPELQRHIEPPDREQPPPSERSWQ